MFDVRKLVWRDQTRHRAKLPAGSVDWQAHFRPYPSVLLAATMWRIQARTETQRRRSTCRKPQLPLCHARGSVVVQNARCCMPRSNADRTVRANVRVSPEFAIGRSCPRRISQSPLIRVYVPPPVSTSRMLPGLRKLSTIIGVQLRWHRSMALTSMMPSRRLMTSL